MAKPKRVVGRKSRKAAAIATITAASARSRFSEIINRTAFGGERVVVTRRGKPFAAVVPIEDLALLEELEGRADARDFGRALAAASRETTVSWDVLKREMGL